MNQEIQTQDWIQYFPFSEVRPEQEKTINFALNEFLSGKKYVILEIPVGGGKSAVAITVARYLEANDGVRFSETGQVLKGSYILTPQKILQKQYMDDFGPDSRNLIVSLQSSSNYTCKFYPQQSCGESRRVLQQLGKKVSGTDFERCCRNQCQYKIDKSNFIESLLGVTNFSYFFAETMYAKKLLPRRLLICDECHVIESELSKVIEITFSQKFSETVLNCKFIKKYDQASVFEWVKKSYKRALSKHIKKVQNLIEDAIAGNSYDFSKLSKQYEMLDKHICKVNRFIDRYNSENWVMNVVKPNPGSRSVKFEFKPVQVNQFGNEFLFNFAEKVLLMSGTIIDKSMFCRTLGISESDVSFMSIDSPFPVENRPVHFLPVGSMSKNTIDKSLPKLVEIVKLLLEKHPQEKGIIHTQNFRIADFLLENIKSDRLIGHHNDDRDAALKNHISSQKPTVLVSPSMMEGVNLNDDLSRFQILCKVPYPYLGDEVVKRRMNADERWYPYQTAKLIIQSLGRSIRNQDDYATSYILDEDWKRFFQKNSHLFSQDFKRALK